jgi:hypothetical protein
MTSVPYQDPVILKSWNQRSDLLEEGNLQATSRLNHTLIRCERCLSGEAPDYLVYTDAMEMAVCPACADEARRLGIDVEPLTQG